MLNNIFINENSLNKLSARTKQTDPTFALDQASSFAGALANQVSINQNSSQQSSSQTRTNHSSQTDNSSSSSQNVSASHNNHTKPDSSTNPETKSNQSDNNGTSSAASTQTKDSTADNYNKPTASTNAASNNTDTKANYALANNTASKKLDIARNIIGKDNIRITDNKGVANFDKNTKISDLPEKFQKIIANLPSHQNRQTKSSGVQSSNLNNDLADKKPLAANPKHIHTNLENNNAHQTELKAKLRTALNNQPLNANDKNLNNKFSQDINSAHISQREHIVSEGKTILNTQKNYNTLINNPVNQQQTDNIASSNQSNPLFGLAATSVITPNNPVNLQNGVIPSNINTPQWGADLGRQVVNMVRFGENGIQTAELRLDPPQLGPLRVTINLNDGMVNAVFSSAHANVRNAIEQSLPQLQQQLQQEGLSLGQTNVGQDNQPSHQAQNGNNKSGANGFAGNQEQTDINTQVLQSNTRATDPNALLDTYA